MNSPLFKLISCSLIFLFILSCSNNPFNPKTIRIAEDNPTNNTPLNVLKNLEKAYNQQDIELYKSCLSPSFRFEIISSEAEEIGIDMNNDGVKDNWWDYQQEITYSENLFKKGSTDGSLQAPSNINLVLTIPPESSWIKDNESGHENWIIIPCYFNLKLSYYNSADYPSSGFARFYLKPENGNWVIAIWRDESNI